MPPTVLETPAVTPASTPGETGGDAITARELEALFKRRPAPAGNRTTPEPTATPTAEVPQPVPEPAAGESPTPAEETPEVPLSAEPEATPEGEAPTTTAEETDVQEFETPAFKRRISEVTAARRQAEQRAAEIEAENRELKRKLGIQPEAPSTTTQPAGEGPQPHAPEPIADQRLEGEIASNQSILEFCARNPDGVADYDFGNGNVRTFSREEIARIQTTANARLAELAAERGVQRAVNRQARVAAVESEISKAAAVYPWLKDANSAQAKAAMAMGRQNPELQNPQGVWDICAAVEARFQRQSPAPAKTPTTPAKKASTPTPVVARPAGGAPSHDRTRGQAKDVEAARQIAEQTGRQSDWARYLALKRQSAHLN